MKLNSIALILGFAVAGLWLGSCASTSGAVALSREIADEQLLGQWGTSPEVTSTTLITFQADGEAVVRALPGPGGEPLNGTFTYRTAPGASATQWQGTLGDIPFTYSIQGKELSLVVSGVNGMNFLNRLKAGPPVVRLDALGQKIADSGMAGVWYFQGRGVGWGSSASTWRDSALVIDPITHRIQYRWRAENQDLKTWKTDFYISEGTIDSIEDGKITYHMTFERSKVLSRDPVTTLYRFKGAEMNWIWNAPNADSWDNYIIYSRQRP